MSSRACGKVLIGVPATICSLSACFGLEAPAVPLALQAAGEHSEVAYEEVHAGRWGAARLQVDSLMGDVIAVDQAVQGQAAAKSELSGYVSELRVAVASRDRLEALSLSNESTRLVAQLTAPYHPMPPVGVALLDYHGRELQLRAETNDPGLLSSEVADLREAWDTIRPTVEARSGGAEQARAFDTLVATAEAATGASAPAELERVSNRILDAVDGLERLFPRTEAPD